jgi:hypothetical protein
MQPNDDTVLFIAKIKNTITLIARVENDHHIW